MMQMLLQKLKAHRRLLFSLLAAAAAFLVFFLVWLAAVRGQGDKSLSAKLSDDYATQSPVVEKGASQSFSYDDDLLALAFVFDIPGEQPAGDLLLTLADADTGEVLATSTGDMANIVSGQYTGMGLSAPVEGTAGRRYVVTLTPQYQGAGRLALGCSDGATLWDDVFTVDGAQQDATLALLVTYRRIGGFLTRFYWCVALALCALVGAACWFGLGKALALHRAVFALIVGLGLLYSVVLPPYAAPDEQYHINQSFTLACRWANALSGDEWQMGHVPLSMSYRRAGDVNPLLQDENTTVFTWQEAANNFLSTTSDSFDSHQEHQEAQVDNDPIPYLPSAAAVFLGFCLHLGFVPTLYLGRLANLLVFAALAAWAVKRTPFARRIFFAAALLPMSLHLAASFSRDAVILGLCFAFTALALDAAFGKTGPLAPKEWLPLAALLLLLAPAKAVYLPLALLVFLIPAARLGRHGRALKWGALAAGLVLAVILNRAMLANAIFGSVEPEDAASTVQALTEAEIQALLPSGKPVTQAEAEAGDRSWYYVPQGDTLAELPEETQAAINAYTTEGFVRRLYYYAEGCADVPSAEVSFWVEALEAGDVSAALLGQSFFFTEDALAEGRFTDAEFVSAVSLAFLHRDIAAGVPSALATVEAGGRTAAYKEIYSAEEGRAFFDAIGVETGVFDDGRVPLSRAELAAEVEAARAADAAQSVATGADAVCYTPGYVLAHPVDTLRLLANDVIQNADHYLRTLVGGSLSYYTLDLAWGWVLALYLLLAFAAMPEPGEAALPAGRARLLTGGAALLCCLLVVAGCITWTPTYYTVLYGLQGRYFLPVLPLLLAAFAPKKHTAAPGSGRTLTAAMAAVNAGVLLNAMLAVMAR